jgi:hypothetical protein
MICHVEMNEYQIRDKATCPKAKLISCIWLGDVCLRHVDLMELIRGWPQLWL